MSFVCRLIFIYAFLLLLWYCVLFSPLIQISRLRKRPCDANRRDSLMTPNAQLNYSRRLTNTASAKMSEAIKPLELSTMTRRADCSVASRFCVYDQDCASLCRSYKNIYFACDKNAFANDDTRIRENYRIGRCAPRAIVDESDQVTPREKCRVELGEYALLVGYTNLGTAIWQCVQLYQQYADRSSFCEGGRFDMNANIREPSYRDCLCPAGTVRAVSRLASMYDNHLPHCIAQDQWTFYRNSMVVV